MMMDYAKTVDKSAVQLTTEVVNKLMEILVSAMFEKRISDLLRVVSVSCISHLMQDEKNDVKKFLTDKVVSTSLGLYKTVVQLFYLAEGGDFTSIYQKSLISHLKITDEKPSKKGDN